MTKYLCLQRSLPGHAKPPSPSQMDEMYARFNAWQDTFKDHIVDLGGRLGAGELVAAGDQEDGPSVEVKELVGGYMVVEAETLDEAVAVARACPGLVEPGSGVEVIEVFSP